VVSVQAVISVVSSFHRSKASGRVWR